MKKLYVGENNAIKWKGLIDLSRSPNEYVNDAELTMSVRTLAGSDVANAGNLSLTYVSGSDGDYIGIVPKTAALTVDTRYNLVASANDADGLRTVLCIATKHPER